MSEVYLVISLATLGMVLALAVLRLVRSRPDPDDSYADFMEYEAAQAPQVPTSRDPELDGRWRRSYRG